MSGQGLNSGLSRPTNSHTVVVAAKAAIVRSGFPRHDGLRKELPERPVLPWPGVHFFRRSRCAITGRDPILPVPLRREASLAHRQL
jgi:hypothetical protein